MLAILAYLHALLRYLWYRVWAALPGPTPDEEPDPPPPYRCTRGGGSATPVAPGKGPSLPLGL